MACRYIYKGHTFNSELELDDFLLEKLPFEPILGDMVFSNTQELNRVLSLITRVISSTREVKARAKEIRRKAKEFDDNGEPLLKKPPYIGVNRFVGEYRTPSGGRIIREFLDEEYWSRRQADWKAGNYTLDEKEIFGITSESGPRVHSLTQLNQMRELITNKWKNLAKAGDAIHNVMLLFFTRDREGHYLFEMSDEEFKQYCLNHLDDDNKAYITGDLIKNVIVYARKLHAEIKRLYGENCIFFPEFTITSETDTVNPDMLLGMIDLLIVDKNGHAHILDYKTSIKPFSLFGSDKTLAYNYQQAIYQRILEKYGIDTHEGELIIAPIQLVGFRKDSDDKWTYDDITYNSELLQILKTQEPEWDIVFGNIDKFLKVPLHLDITTDQAISTVAEMMNKWYPDFPDGRLTTEEAVLNWLKKKKLLTRNKNNLFVFNRSFNKQEPIVSTDEAEFVQKVTEYMNTEIPKCTRKALLLKNILKRAMKDGIDSVEFPTPIYTDENLTWLRDTLSPYCNGNWEIDDTASSLLELFGIIMVRTKKIDGIPPQIDFIRVSTRDLSTNYREGTSNDNPFKKRKSLVGALMSDLEALTKQDNLMMEAAIGNVELMETMLIINLIIGLHNYTIGNIQVVNPLFGNGLQASNEELSYCFNELCKKEPIPHNRFATGEIKLASKIEQVRFKLAHALETGSNNKWANVYLIFKDMLPAVDIIDRIVDGPVENEAKIEALLKCLDMLTGKGLGSLRNLYLKLLDVVSELRNQASLKLVHVDLYNTIVMAIGELKGIKYRLLLNDHYQWFSNILKAGSEGLTGNYSDNPGNLRSETLNLITKLVTEAYQNTRDELLRRNTKLKKLVQNLKDKKRMGGISENTIGNLVSLYKNMYRETEDGDLEFVDPSELHGAEREFLEFILDEINRDRFPQHSEAERKMMKDTHDPKYYKVPLCVGGFDSIASEKGLLSMLWAKLLYFWPPKAWEMARLKLEGVFSESEEERDRQNKTSLLFKMKNMFDIDIEARASKIRKMREKNLPLELNFETLTLKHMFAYSSLRHMDEVFPLIKSSLIHILMLGALQSTNFTNDIKFITEYIESKIFNQSIVSKENRGWVKYANVLKQAASMFTLALAPVLMFYQPLLGLWNDISLMIRKPDLKESFTFLHFIKSIKLVFGDLVHFSDKPTLCLLLNELYGINDMDMNTYVDRISTAKKGIWNISSFLFKFASRPDFYNRMTIFTSLMMGDGCLEAHSINEDGRLVYNWEKDKRFSKFAEAVRNGNPNSTDPEVGELRSRYYAVAQLFVNEHARDENGDLFVLDMNNPRPLPRAYTNKQAESMKSLGDNIYGYYSHEKKSLIMSTCIGSLWLQFRTYWSGKKNLYLAHSGVKLLGDWKQYEERNGNEVIKYYYLVNENGVVLYNEPPIPDKKPNDSYTGPLADTPQKQAAPVILWRGLWQEGIMLTLADLAKNMWNAKSIKKGWEMKFGPDVDPYLRKVYVCNMQQLAYDFLMFAVVGSILGALLGDWLDKLEDENKRNKDFVKGLGLSAANIAVMSVRNSFLDFNFFTSVGAPFGQWTPFSVEWTGRVFYNWYKVAVGDEDFWDGVVKTSGGLKLIKPALDTIKPSFWKTEREGGTFNKD